jgi:sulfonate transport system permease protein
LKTADKKQRNTPRAFWQSFLLGAPLPIVLLILWEVAVRKTWLPPTLIASPSAVALDFAVMLANGTLALHISVSLARLAFGLSIGVAAGLFLGSVLALSRLFDGVVSPSIQILSPVPVIAWTPLLITFFGIDGARIALIAVGGFFIVFFGAFQGIRNTDLGLIEMARMYQKSSLDLVRHVLLPSAMPQIFDALRLTLGIGWVLLLIGEIIASSSGLGWLIWDSRNFSRPDDMIVGMITVGILGKLSDMALARLQAHCLRWRPSFAGQ